MFPTVSVRYVSAALAAVAAIATFATISSRAQSSPRVFELRTYTCNEGMLPALQKRFRDHTMKLFEQHGMTNVGYWVPQDEPRSKTTLIYIISHANREAAKKNWADFQADPVWQKVRTESEANGKIVAKVESVFMDSTDYSPMK